MEHDLGKVPRTTEGRHIQKQAKWSDEDEVPLAKLKNKLNETKYHQPSTSRQAAERTPSKFSNEARSSSSKNIGDGKKHFYSLVSSSDSSEDKADEIEDEETDDNEVSDGESTLTDNDVVKETQEVIHNRPKRKLTDVTPIRKQQRKSEDSDKLDRAFQILSKASANANNPEGHNECQIFGNLVAKKLAKYSPELQTNTQQAIMNILFKADSIHIRQNSSNFQSPPQRTDTIHSFFSNYQANQESCFNQEPSQLSSPTYSYGNSNPSTSSDNNTPLPPSLPHELLDMSHIELQSL
ncbi:unnamed protein product [Acanthoscelides obtectus]|uniref:BESS domain-containing protein n=1 Tax=Acanthoscelides obtectus TaxID=200917 RepID=A0A9P0JUE6_ACAOB|nr:unnamed protein product [Acanthoscelides obtectus]CAK1627920.1 hypothetical protein AOBTE_LOCUS4906 [Acanthoscelides obtectus]